MTQSRVWFNGQYDWGFYSFSANPLVWTYPQNEPVAPKGSSSVGTYEWKQVSGVYAGTTSTALSQRGLAVGLKTDGTLWQWIHNYTYDDTKTDRYKLTSIATPTQLSSDNWTKITTNVHKDYAATGIKTITVGSATRYLMWLGIKSDGTLWEFYGRELSDVLYIETPVQVSGTWTDVAQSLTINGRWVAAAIKSDGTLWAWGDNTYNQCGQSSGSSYSTPQQIGSDTDWTKVAVNDTNGWALKSNGTVYAWGQGQTTGYYQTTGSNISTPVQLTQAINSKTVTKIVAHVIGASGITNESTANCYSWGKPTGLGQLSSNSDRRPTAIDLSHLGDPSYKFLDIGSTYISTTDGTFIGGASNGQIYKRFGSHTFYPVDTSWVDDIAGSNPTRTGSDWILGSSFYNREYVLINSLPPTLTVTSDLTSNKCTDGVLSLSIATTFASINVDWGDSSADTDYSYTTSSTHTPSHDYKPNITIDSLITATITASNERYSDVVTSLTNMQVFDSPYSPTFTTNKDGEYSYGGYVNYAVTTTSPAIVFTNTTSAEPGVTSTFANNKYQWAWGDSTTTDLNVGAGSAGTPGNGTISKTYTFNPSASQGKKSLALQPTLRIYTDSTNSPWASNKNIKIWREPSLNFALDNANTDSIVFLQNTSLYAGNYVIYWDATHTSTITNNNVPGGGDGIPISFDYQATGGVTADGPQSIYITSPFTELNQTYTSSTLDVDVFLVHSPTISCATSRLVRPAGSTNTGNITFTNNVMSTTPGLTADYPTNYWYWQWDDGTTSDIDVEVGLAGNAGTNITKNLALSISNGVGIQSQVFDVTASLYTDHPSAPFTSNTHALTTYLQPSLDFSLAASGNNLRITNSSLNAGSYVINIQRTTTYGVTTETISIPSNAVAGGSGSTYYSIPVTADTDFSVYLTTTLPGSGTVYTSATKTQKVYAVVSPSFVIESNTSIPTGYPFEFRNTTTNGVLGYTSIFTGNKWRWEWGDGNYTDVNVGAGANGDVSIPIEKIYTLTIGQINAGLPVTFNVTLKAYNGHSSSPFASASQTVTVLPINPNFPNRSFPTLDDAGIPDIVKVKTTQVWGVRGGGNT